MPRQRVVDHFLRLSHSDIVTYNWGEYEEGNPKLWRVDDGTYINGIPLIVDRDLSIGYLLEVVERDTGAVSYLVVVRMPLGDFSAWWERDAGTFFERNFAEVDVGTWAVEAIYELLDAPRRDQPLA